MVWRQRQQWISGEAQAPVSFFDIHEIFLHSREVLTSVEI